MNKISILLVPFIFAVSGFTVFYLKLFQRQRFKTISLMSLVPHFILDDTCQPKAAEFDKENLTHDLSMCICSLINTSDYDARQKLIIKLHQASSFRCNFGVIRDSKCLETLLSLLDPTADTLPESQQNLNVLQVVINLACDHQSFPIIKDYLDNVLSIADKVEYSGQACAALQVLGNIALTPDGCELLRDKCGYLCNLLRTRDPYVLRNVLVVLVNLSCDSNCCKKLLSENREEFMLALEYSLSSNAPTPISLKMADLLKSLYWRIIQEREASPKSPNFPLYPQSIGYYLKDNYALISSWILPLMSSSEDWSEVGIHLQKLASSL